MYPDIIHQSLNNSWALIKAQVTKKVVQICNIYIMQDITCVSGILLSVKKSLDL